MARFQITGTRWVCGPPYEALFPGDILDSATDTWLAANLANWYIPPNAMAMDQGAYDILAHVYPAAVILSDPTADINRWKDPLG